MFILLWLMVGWHDWTCSQLLLSDIRVVDGARKDSWPKCSAAPKTSHVTCSQIATEVLVNTCQLSVAHRHAPDDNEALSVVVIGWMCIAPIWMWPQMPPSCCTTTSSQHARPSGVLRRLAWNALPDDLRDPSLSADIFRKRLKRHVFPNALGHSAH